MAVEVKRLSYASTEGQKKFHLDAVEPFTPQIAFDLLKSYWNNRESYDFDSSLETPQNIVNIKPDVDKSRIKGILLIQNTVLKTLGLENLMGKKRPRHMHFVGFNKSGYIEADHNVYPVNKDRIDRHKIIGLLKRYREDKRLFSSKSLDQKDLTKFTTEEAEIFGRVTMLGSVLDHLGQRRIVHMINLTVESKSDKIDWAANRSTGLGELL